MRRDHSKLVALAAAAGLALAGCGGSDDEPAAESPSAAVDADAGDDGAGDAADDARDDAADDGAGDDGAGDDGGGSSGRDDLQQSLDDVGVDLDLEGLEETISGFSTGEGGGVVTIDGVAYTFEATAVCIWQGTDFVAEGLGSDPAGNPAWVSINASDDDFDGDGNPDRAIDVFVEVGRTELFGDGPDDAPDFVGTYYDSDWMSPEDEIVYELSNGILRGSGPVQDYSGTAIPFGERGQMTFEASCT